MLNSWCRVNEIMFHGGASHLPLRRIVNSQISFAGGEYYSFHRNEDQQAIVKKLVADLSIAKPECFLKHKDLFDKYVQDDSVPIPFDARSVKAVMDFLTSDKYDTSYNSSIAKCISWIYKSVQSDPELTEQAAKGLVYREYEHFSNKPLMRAPPNPVHTIDWSETLAEDADRQVTEGDEHHRKWMRAFSAHKRELEEYDDSQDINLVLAKKALRTIHGKLDTFDESVGKHIDLEARKLAQKKYPVTGYEQMKAEIEYKRRLSDFVLTELLD